MEYIRWFDRNFPPITDNRLFPNMLERLEGTGLRLRAKVSRLTDEVLKTSIDGQWTIKEEVGHLGDLEPLWYGRFNDFLNGLEELRPADLTNAATNDAGHNDSSITELLDRFETSRNKLTRLLRSMEPPDLQLSALHPRLKTNMHPIDLAYFIAEHDDQHLSHITRKLRAIELQKK